MMVCTAHRRPYGSNSYTFYDSSSALFLYGGPDDRRLLALERVVAIDKGTASTLDNRDMADGRDVGAAGVFGPVVKGRRPTFRLVDGRILGDQTGSTWNFLGKAAAGPLVGKELRPLVARAGPVLD